MAKRKKRHGPRYAIKGKRRAWVVRDVEGKFKKWVNKKRSISVDKLWKAPKGKHPGYGHRKDYSRYRKKKSVIEKVLS